MNYESRIDDSVGNDETFAPDEGGGRSRLTYVVIAVVVLLIMIGTWFVTHRNSIGVAEGEKTDQVPVVTVVTPGRGTIAGTINATGTLAARRELPVGSVGEGGQVVSVLVEPGQWVGQGQVLAVVDRSVQNQQQASQSAQINVSLADARLAQSNLDRSLKLVARGFVSKADVDRLTATRDAANARVQVARAQLGTLRAQSARLNIVAPAAGLILERNVEPGQVVGAGAGVLFRIAKGGEMELLARLGEDDLAKIAAGVSVDVVPSGSQQHFTGQIWQIAPVIDPQTRQGTARVALAYAPELRPGGFAAATINSGTLVAPMLPESAILSDEDGSYVFVVGAGNKVERRKVRTGMITDNGIAIAEGLNGSEQIVLRAGGFLQPGEVIKPKPGKL